MEVTAGIVAKRYQILSELGRGGMGVVYRVRHCFTGEKLALKVLNDSLLQQDRAVSLRDRKKKSDQGSLSGEPMESPWTVRFKREMQISAKINNEHVVRITDADVAPELGGSLFYVMELLRGSDLDHLLQDRGSFTAEETVWIVYQLAEGLDKAHKVGVVHRDLKPANLFIHNKSDSELILKILDFGLAFLVSDAPKAAAADKLTKTGATLGTLNYFAPEQAMGLRELISPPTDVWAIGTIVFELLTGDCYFPGNDHTVAVRIARGEVKPPSLRVPSLAKSFDAWFLRACALDPQDRFTTVAEQALKLAEALGISEETRQKLASGTPPDSLQKWAQERPGTSENDLLQPPVDPMAETRMGRSADPRAAAQGTKDGPAVHAKGAEISRQVSVVSVNKTASPSIPTHSGTDAEASASNLAKAGASTTQSAAPVGRLTPFQLALLVAAFALVAVLAMIPIALMRRTSTPTVATPTVATPPFVKPEPATVSIPQPKSAPVIEPPPATVATPPPAAEEDDGKDAKNKKKHRSRKNGKPKPDGKTDKPGVFDPSAP